MNNRRQRHFGELAVDLAIVIGSLLYLRAASNYPPEGRQIPDVVGYLALGLGALHLLAHAIPALWTPTHGTPGRRTTAAAVPERPAVAPRAEADGPVPDPAGQAAAPAPVTLDVEPGRPRQVVAAMAWVVGLLAGTYVLGYVVAIPVFFLAYFGAMRQWRTAVISAVVMAVVAQELFVTALAVPLPRGLL